MSERLYSLVVKGQGHTWSLPVYLQPEHALDSKPER